MSTQLNIMSLILDRIESSKQLCCPIQYIKLNKEIYRELKKECCNMEGIGISGLGEIKNIFGIKIIVDKEQMDWIRIVTKDR